MGRILRRIESTGPVKNPEAETTTECLPEINNLSLHSPATSVVPSSTAAMPVTFLPILNLSKSRGSSITPMTIPELPSTKPSQSKGSMEVGLENLGNSCFMNSALQCLLHIEPLTSYFLSGNHTQELNVNSPMKGCLAATFGQLVKDMYETKEGGVLSPVQFFKQLRLLAPHLLDYQQQDSQEFLRFLLDGLCEDLCRRKPGDKKATVERLSFRQSPLRNLEGRDELKVRRSFRRSLHEEDTRLEGGDRVEDRNTSGAASKQTKCIGKSPLATRALLPYNSPTPKPEVDAEAEVAPAEKSLDDEARAAWEVYMRFNDSIVADLFAGQLQSTVRCLTCNTKSHCFDPFLDLSVPIPRGQESKLSFATARLRGRGSIETVRCSLEECLQNFTSEEVLDEENMFHCDCCKTKRKGTKALALYKYPKVLVIHIKRFKVGKLSREKLTTDVVFPLKGLNLTPFVSRDRSPESVQMAMAPPIYDLLGISHHSGTMQGGHYVATIDINNAKEGTQRWVNFNDSKVTSVGVSTLNGPSAYVLFYKLQEDSVVS